MPAWETTSSIYFFLPNVISNKAIMNVACSMRNAWEIVEPLA
jgi:hypothetical protein